ncbi:MAG: hypothetical protein IPJ77_13100 [Planctomycetes bacterium]|nr:hypothetical protein [Planctomycetota bacterium]
MASHLVRIALLAPLALAASGLVVGCRTHGDLPFDSTTSGDAVYVAQVDVDGATAWAQAKVTLSNLSLRPLSIDETRRRATTEIEETEITVECSTYDLKKSEVKVSGHAFLRSGNAVARKVYDQLLADLRAKK